MRRQYRRRISAIFMAALMVFLNGAVIISADDNIDNHASASPQTQNASDVSGDYFAYYNKYFDINAATEEIVLDSSTAIAIDGKELKSETVSDNTGLVMDDENDGYEWQVTVPRDAKYYIYVNYYPLEDNGKDILLSLKIDGKFPYSEASGFLLPRSWTDGVDGSFEIDSQGNDMRPKQVEKAKWSTHAVQDVIGLYEEPYFVYLTAGVHTLSFGIEREKMLLGNITLKNESDVISYKEYISNYDDEDFAKGDVILQQAEKTFEKSSSTLVPVYDRTTSATIPCDYAHIRLNTIGKGNWGRTGTSISWEADVEKTGLYQLSFRARQDLNQGVNSCRTLTINGEIPFEEAKNIVFPYEDSWYIKTLGDDKPQYVYLEPGDIITLTVSAGPLSFALREIKQSILNLNQIYREIILITGLTPDMYQDYNLEDRIPGLCEDLGVIRDNLQDVYESIKKQMGKSDAMLSNLKRSIQIYTELADDPYTIPERLSNYKDSIENLGALILSLGNQPLELDYLAYIPKGESAPKANASFFSQLKYSVMKFISSFSYANITEENKKDELSVWVATGRDQMQILNQMINSDFSNNHDVVIRLNMVNTGDTLIQATLAGQGPDVALMIPEITPVNLAMRGELVPLNTGKYDIDDLYSEFPKAAWTPFYYLDNLYALPETMNFDVLFYRTDVFEELGITPPSTWEEFYDVMRVIQSNNLLVAVPEINSVTAGVSASIGIFDKFLLQNGGTYYTEDNSKTAFDQNVAINAFEKWTELYTVYGLDRDLNFYNRFRSGEAIMGIMPYMQYNLLTAGALELDGTWTFTTVPGEKQKDGSVNRAETANVTACIMLNSAKEKGVDDSAFKFMKWWVSANSQTEYGRTLEAALGVSARYTPANIKALEAIGWNDQELAVLKEQMLAAVNVPQIPGNYVVSRSLTSALRAAIAGTYTPGRAISIWNKDINNEIHRKRVEFELE